MTQALRLVSHHLCPYVQRAIIVAAENGIAVERQYIDLADKPDWFPALSPTGKVPLLRVGETSVFESAVICEYLDEISEGSLHPADPLERAKHRSWMEFASAVLGDVGGLYTAPDDKVFEQKRTSLTRRFDALERVSGEPYFAGEQFHMVDAFYGSVFRYFDVIEAETALRLFTAAPRVAAWRRTLASRASIATAVALDYAERLKAFLIPQAGASRKPNHQRQPAAAAARGRLICDRAVRAILEGRFWPLALTASTSTCGAKRPLETSLFRANLAAENRRLQRSSYGPSRRGKIVDFRDLPSPFASRELQWSGGDVSAWCRLSDSNRRPTAYKAVALPAELSRRRPFHPS